MKKKRGIFITLEGMDGIGKSTQIKKLSQLLTDKGIDVYLTSEPQGSQLGRSLASILKHEIPMSPFSEVLLFSAARIEHIHEIILPYLQKGSWVLSDRFIHSTRAYQGISISALEENLYKDIEDYCLSLVRPDLTFILDGDPARSLARKQKKQQKDLFEERGIAYMTEVREQYKKVAEQDKDYCILIDGEQKEEEVTRQIITHIEQRLW